MFMQFDFGSLIQRTGNFLLVILLAGGFISLRFDLREMALKKLKREERAARVLGWLQISLGVSLWFVRWLVTNFF
jgi:hypothetical protein